MAAPDVIVNGLSVIGSTALELRHARTSDKEATSAISARSLGSLTGIDRERITTYCLPIDCTDEELLAFSSAFPRDDFGRFQTNQPHAAAVAARNASIATAISNAQIVKRRPSRITLVGPSYSQFLKMRLAFPSAEVVVFQPTTDARDSQRWSEHVKDIYDGEWSEKSAIATDFVFSFYSIGNFSAEDFARALVVARPLASYVLHHLPPQALIASYHDPIFKLDFNLRDNQIEAAFADSPSYLDSVQSIRSWLTCDFRIPSHGFFVDVLADLSSLKLLKITMGVGKTTIARTDLFDFSSAYHVLPATIEHEIEVIPTKLWEPVLDYAQRQRADLLSHEIIRNRISSLKHKVSIGSAVIQSAIFCSDKTADHLAEIAAEVVKLRNSLALQKEARTQRGIEARSGNYAFLAGLNEKSGGVLRVADTFSRCYINALFAPKALLTGTPLIGMSSNIPSTDQLTLAEKITAIVDSRPARLELLQRTLKEHSVRAPVQTAALSARLRALQLQRRAEALARQSAYFWVQIINSLAPMEIRYALARATLFALNGPVPIPACLKVLRQLATDFVYALHVGENLVDRLIKLLLDHFGFDRAEFQLPTNRIPRNGFAPPTASSSSSSDSDSNLDDQPIEIDAEPPAEIIEEAPAALALDPPTEDAIIGEITPLGEDADHSATPILDETTDELDVQLEENEVGVDGNEAAELPREPFNPALDAHILTGRIDLQAPLSRPMNRNDPALDQACPLLPFPDFNVKSSTLRSLNHTQTLQEITVGPNTMKRAITYAITSSHASSVPSSLNEEVIRHHRALKKPASNPENTENGSVKFAEAEAAVRALPKKIKKLDAIVSGLPAAGKSSVIIPLMSDRDVVITSTGQHARKWRLDLRAAGVKAEVLTQHQLFKEDYVHGQFRVVWIDECFLLELNHVLHLALYGKRCVGLGDSEQIKAFHVRKSKAKYSLKQHCARVWINAPFSLGLPTDVLILGKKLGFVSGKALTFGTTEKSLFFLDEKPEFEAPSPNHRNIVFNREYRTEGISITAHMAQGDRPETALVRMETKEANFIGTAHFWVAISRATRRTDIWLSTAAQTKLEAEERLAVQGFIRDRSAIEALPFCGSTDHSSCIDKLQRASTAATMADFGLSAESFEFMTRDVPTAIENPALTDPFSLTKEQINSALNQVNANFEQIKYADAVDMHDMSFEKDVTAERLSVLLDLKASEKEATSTLNKAGVYFASDDTKTEFFTIATRYLSQMHTTLEDPMAKAQELLAAFETAYIDPKKTSATLLPRAASFNDWINSRTPSLFQPDTSVFAEESHTTTFSSFLKAHAKAKNDAGFGTKQEKGQTIAAGHQSYNARMTAVCREAQAITQQIKHDAVFLDIGFADEEFEAFCTENELCQADNTQIDLSSQDSTHFEHDLMALILFLLKYTSMTPDEAILYYKMRSEYTVRAASFSTNQRLRYVVKFFLPSGDPFTLFANCFMEMSSIAYVFVLPPLNRKELAAAFKGDDTYIRWLLWWHDWVRERAYQIGVLLKIDFGLPPFFAGRYILPDNTVHHDAIKHAAKYSVKRFDPTRISEYVIAYRQLLPYVSVYHSELLLRYGLAHHPSMDLEALTTLTTFAHSLKTYPGFLRFQDFRRLSEQYVDSPSNCFAHVCGALHLPRIWADPTPRAIVRHLEEIGANYIYRPHASRIELRLLASRFPLRPVFSNSHCLAFLPSSRYSDVTTF